MIHGFIFIINVVDVGAIPCGCPLFGSGVNHVLRIWARVNRAPTHHFPPASIIVVTAGNPADDAVNVILPLFPFD